jgi:hypothetical protein
MKLDEAEREIFCEIQQEFVDEFGVSAMMAVYRMHREFVKRLGYKNFPASDLKDLLLFNMLESERFKGFPLREIFLCLQNELGIKEATFYSFYHDYYLPRKKEKKKSSTK